MNELESAIELVRFFNKFLIDIKAEPTKIQSLAIAVQALQAQAERDKLRCENCKNIRFNDNFHWCGCAAGLDGNRKVTDFCSYFEPKENGNG